MKILFTGGGSGGHFYPIIAVSQAIREVMAEKKMIEPIMYFMAPDPYDEKILFSERIIYKKVPAGKIRRYFSLSNYFDWFKTGLGILKAVWQVFWIYPDIIFSKGGYGSFPAVMAGKILRIPIIIHESDSVPGKVNMWSSKFAYRIAISFPDAANFFPKEKIALTGNPIRKELFLKAKEGAREYLELEEDVPVIFILGGSQGAQIINDAVVSALDRLVEKYQIIHQTGEKNIKEIKESAQMILGNSEYIQRYKPFPYLNNLSMRMAAGACNLIISRAGSTIFEIANWKVPSIIIPITETNEDHQRKNAYNYARSKACVVIEEANLNSEILINEIDRILEDSILYSEMKEAAGNFARPDAAREIAELVISVIEEHEK